MVDDIHIPLRTLPNFVVIGAPKCGTTSLFYYLKQHPKIYLPIRKELHYFSYAELSANQEGPGDSAVVDSICKSWDEYCSHYNGASGFAAVGEVSPSYLYLGVQERIKARLGKVRIIALLRSPVDRAYSQYLHLLRSGREELSFLDALAAESERIEKGWADIWHYANGSMYSRKLEHYINCFGRENVHITYYENMKDDAEREVEKIFRFLGIESRKVKANRVYNRSGSVRSHMLARFLSTQNQSRLKVAAKQLIPERARIAIRMRLIEINAGPKPPMADDARDLLRQRVLAESEALERLIGERPLWHA